ncbi:N-acetyltransferase [Streptacidiphilus sp. PB12-B1b]|uniref:GNAT family N-acetyltransferase n=1 Tax=Streptacidiphilus sp. PB12-B1b TaxID=2705012 RepID=UPI0015FE2C84|nr:N-acetyltransferase [Streptacidiphilus sp. PB12-B1b]QMU75649.1 N-acetyltransferase [Streptacidiphilus sp. PB12-B1b]
MTDHAHALVPDDFVVPTEFNTAQFRLEPLGPQHNAADHAAWTSSIEHIRATPGFQGKWPPADGMTPEANLIDLQRHADDFVQRRGFTYTVIEPVGGELIGCVYIYPSRSDGHDTDVRSWVRADRAELDVPLHVAVKGWLSAHWPLSGVNYPLR